MRHSAEFDRFDALVRQVIAVPRAEVVRREAAYKKQAALNPHKRGPKPKRKPDESHAPADQPPS
jgi:hypothetical protein